MYKSKEKERKDGGKARSQPPPVVNKDFSDAIFCLSFETLDWSGRDRLPPYLLLVNVLNSELSEPSAFAMCACFVLRAYAATPLVLAFLTVFSVAT